MKQCTLFPLQEATWAISNVTAGPKEQIQVKIISLSQNASRKVVVFTTHVLVAKNAVHLFSLFFYCGSGTCTKWTVTSFQRILTTLAAIVCYNKSFICLKCTQMLVWKAFFLTSLELVTGLLLSANSQVLKFLSWLYSMPSKAGSLMCTACQ